MGRSPSPRLAWLGTSHAGRCVGNGPGYGSASSTACSSAFERLSEMPGGGFRAWAATASMAGPPTAAMVAAASRPACEDDASSRGVACLGTGDVGRGPASGAQRATTSSPPWRASGASGGWRPAEVASAVFTSGPCGTVAGARSASPAPTGRVETGCLLPVGRWGPMSGAPSPSSTRVTTPSDRARGAAVWTSWPEPASAAGDPPAEGEVLPPEGAAEGPAVGR